MKSLIENAYRKTNQRLIRTPLIKSESLESAAGGHLYLKMESEQITGSFKLRGVLNKFSELSEQGIDVKRVVAASTGNHALAVCYTAELFHSVPIIFVPESVSKSKLQKLVDRGVEIHKIGEQSGETEQIAIKWARENGIPMIHPYSDFAVIAGQGTIALELAQQLGHMDEVFVPVGGGGLISGIAAYLKSVKPSVRIIGVQPENACEMTNSIGQGHIVEPSKLPTISDGTAGGLDPETITYRICQDLVDEFVTVTEVEMVKALQLVEKHHQIMVEPAAGLALAGIIKVGQPGNPQTRVAVISGANINRKQYLDIIRDFS
jgi:threonine dehydratase